MGNGYISIHRQIENSKVWKSKPFSKGQAWIDLLLCTQYQEGLITAKNGIMIDLERGECGYSILAFADRWGWSRDKVKRYLDWLEIEKMIHQKKVCGRIIIKVLNYDIYQNNTVNKSVNNTVNRQQTSHQTDINNKDNNVNNDNNISSLHANEKQKIYGEYQNVLLEEKDYQKLLGICASTKLLNDVVNELSENIEIGKAERFKTENPKAHFVLLKKYIQAKRNRPNPQYQQKQERKLTPEEELALYNDDSTYRPY